MLRQIHLLRPVAALLLIIGAASCSDISRPGERVGPARLELRPRFEAAAAQSRASRSALGLDIANVRIVITRPPDVVLKDTVIAFTSTSQEMQLELLVLAPTVRAP